MRRMSRLVPALVAALALLAVGGCKSNRTAFPGDGAVPAPAPAPASPAGGGSGGGTQELGSEGFEESALGSAGGAGAGEGGVREVPGGALDGSALGTVYFDYDSPQLGDEALRTLEGNAAWLRANPAVRVEIQGHCDERGTIEYNLSLGSKRANAVRDHLARLGVAISRLEAVSYGKEKPAVPGNDESAWAKNRRAEFVVIGR